MRKSFWSELVLTVGLLLMSSACQPPAAAPDRLQVTRWQGLYPLPPLPLTEITDLAAVSALYHDLLALPSAPTRGAMSCPAGNGLYYHLRFLSRERVVQDARMDAAAAWTPVRKLASSYGEDAPRVTFLQSNRAPDGRMMYHVGLTGNFSHDGLHASHLIFDMWADGSAFWSLQGLGTPPPDRVEPPVQWEIYRVPNPY